MSVNHTNQFGTVVELKGHEAEDRRYKGVPVHEAWPRPGVGKCPPTPSPREGEVDRISSASQPLQTPQYDQCACFDVYPDWAPRSNASRDPSIKEVSQGVRR